MSVIAIGRLSTVTACFLACLLFAIGESIADDRPNIVIMLADDMGYCDLGSYGGEIETPHLDSLAYGGLRFTNFYTNNMCVPCRASLLTGTYNTTALSGGALSARVRTIAQMLKTSGYATAMSGKWHLGSTRNPATLPPQRGFERFYGTIIGAGSFYAPAALMRGNESAEHEWRDDPKYYYTDAISHNAVDFVNKASADKPLFLYVAYTAAHWPLHAFESDIAKYKGKYAMGWDELRKQRHERMKKLGVVNPNWALSPRHPKVPAWKDETNKAWQQRRMEVYAAQVDRMDRGIGKVLGALKQTGRFKNTLVMYLQDNGACHVEYTPKRKGSYLPEKTRDGKPMRPGNLPDIMPGPEDTYQSYGYGWANVSNTPFRLFKQHDHEGGIRTPCIAHWPKGIKHKGKIVTQLGHIVDVMPTCLELAGAEYPKRQGDTELAPLEGSSLLPILKGQDRPQPKSLYWKFAKGQAVRQGQWKLVKVRGGNWELYDVEADGTELKNLAGQMPGRVKQFSILYNAWLKRTTPTSGSLKKKKKKKPAK